MLVLVKKLVEVLADLEKKYGDRFKADAGWEKIKNGGPSRAAKPKPKQKATASAKLDQPTKVELTKGASSVDSSPEQQ